ncbi:MAG: heat-inducible transcriptional repressor HrcA [Chloroflexota bacterium]|nr:heat-inducible transcriptional repressor HrcA [Dehalococcoidia bacterium]MDW8252451.1 heat-inducible transcriptional repressor HrcA [Chloroflexota bacterium]
MLSERQAALLKIIVGEYVASAAPVGSSSLVKKYRLPVSSATVRNEMAELEENGFVTHPHTSAGRVPSDRGYRYYVESLPEPLPLPEPIRRAIRREFRQAELDVEEWSRLAATVLARLVQNAALVTAPKASDVRLRHLELVELHATLAMLILVLREARVKPQMVTLARPTDQEELHAVSARLNQLLAGAGPKEIDRVGREAPLSPLEQQILAATKRSLEALASAAAGEVTLAGLADVLSQPEFSEGRRAQQIVEVLNHPEALVAVLADLVRDAQFQVIIGTENPEESLRDYSFVIAQYGVPGEMSGLIGVMGPTRMPYERTIPTVQYVASLMTELVREVSGVGSARRAPAGE